MSHGSHTFATANNWILLAQNKKATLIIVLDEKCSQYRLVEMEKSQNTL